MEDQNHILFESYLSEELSPDEKLAFELRLKTEPKLKKDFKTYKELTSFLTHKFDHEEASEAFKNNLKTISNTYFEKGETPKKTIRFKPWQYAIAASVVLLVGVFVFNNFSSLRYTDFHTHQNISLTVRGDNPDLLHTAETAFNHKDFAKAETAFKALLDKGETNSELKLYSAIANIELSNYERAETLLNELKDGQSVYKNKAIWYLALSKLKQKNYEACLSILKTIPEDAEDYKQAQKLIKKLD